MLAKTLFCLNSTPEEFSPCGRCEACAQVEASTHPDLIQIARKPDKVALSIDQFIGEDENRMREGMCYEIRMKPYSGRRKIAIVDDADTIGVEGANSLLKTLEEPPPGSLIFLISTSLQRQLPTIRSRCQVVRFQPLSEENLATLANRQGLTKDPAEAAAMARHASGSLAAFRVLLDPELREFQVEILRHLSQRPFDFIKFAKAVQANVESAGSESQAKRERLKLLIDFVQQHHRTLLVSRLSEGGYASEAPLAVIKRCLDAREHLDRMVSAGALIEAWAADLAGSVTQ